MNATRAVVLTALLASGCAGRAGSAPPEDAPSRQSLIYAAVIRQLVTVDHTFGGDPGFGTIFVLDRADPRAGEGIAPQEDEGTPISAEVQEEIRAELGDLPPVRFVATREEVVGPMEDGGVVEDNGAFVTLGTIPAEGDRVEIGAGMYIANLAGTWLTYVVRHNGEGWEVTGTTGPVAIS